MKLNGALTYIDIVINIEVLKDYYNSLLASFSFFDNNNDELREFKENIYSLNFPEWQKDKIWEYLNDDVDYDLICRFK